MRLQSELCLCLPSIRALRSLDERRTNGVLLSLGLIRIWVWFFDF